MQWVFFDIGIPIYDEEIAIRDYLECISRHFGIDYATLKAEEQELIRERAPAAYRAIIRGHSAPGEYERNHSVIAGKRMGAMETKRVQPGIFEVLECLRGKGYRLGIISNQGVGIRARLEADGILGYFGAVAISDELGIAKPDRRIFEWALAQAKASPRDCWMVGDRIDNDVIPAKALGMRTVWLHAGPHSADSPRNKNEEPNIEIRDIRELLSAL